MKTLKVTKSLSAAKYGGFKQASFHGEQESFYAALVYEPRLEDSEQMSKMNIASFALFYMKSVGRMRAV